MAFVPIIEPNRRKNSYRSRSGTIFTAVALALVFLGLMFFFMFSIFDFNGFSFPIVPMISGFIFIFLMITCISAISISMSEVYKKPKEKNLKSYNSQFRSESQTQKQQYNPYIIPKSLQNQNEPEEQIFRKVKYDIPSVPIINFCRFCGAKLDRDAIFCHQCGTNISS
ncbi:MAG: zinc ribbon domain-containing protein [Promethearchaeota archaeon]